MHQEREAPTADTHLVLTDYSATEMRREAQSVTAQPSPVQAKFVGKSVSGGVLLLTCC